MSGLNLFDAGFTDLVSVIPPGASLSSGSGVKENQRGKVPGVCGVHGWHGYSWLTHECTREDVEDWDESCANIGMLAARFPALDIDSKNEKLVAAIKQHAERTLGWAPERIGAAPKTLLPYKTNAPFARMAAVITYKGEAHLIEFLGAGRQYLVFGTHPSGVEYTWDVPLSEYTPNSLTLITRDMVQEFFTTLRDKLEEKGIACKLVGDGVIKETREVEQDELLAPSLEALDEAVSLIPNDLEERDDYITFGCAVKAAGAQDPEFAFAIFDEWCMTWEGNDRNPEGNDADTARADWERMYPPFRVGWEYIVDMAGAHGFDDATYDFDAEPAPEGAEEEEAIDYTRALSLTERWAAEMILPSLIGKVLYLPTSKLWYVWDGTRWRRDEMNRAEYIVQETLTDLSHDLHRRAEGAPNAAQGRPARQLASRVSTNAMLNAILNTVQRDPKITTRVDMFDVESMLLNTPTGVVELETSLQKPNDPVLRCSKVTACGPEGGNAPLWFRFLQEATGGDRTLMRFMQKQAGYALTGKTKEQTLTFIWGPSLTGKSVFLDTIARVLGDYHETAAMDTFTSSRNDRHPADLAKLVGARLVTASETQEGRAWDEQRVKTLTGGDKVSARFMRGNFFDYYPQFKLVIIGNHEPQIKNPDDAMRRRIHIVPFTVHPKEIDDDLKEKLEAEYPQILAWMIEGCMLWQKEGLTPPDTVLLRTLKYFKEEDVVQQWLDDCCVLEEDATQPRTELFTSWRQWCGAEGIEPGSQKSFKRAIDKRHILPDVRMSDRARSRAWRGIRLTEEEE